MEIILLERIRKLGQMGDVVTVKDGFARNFLLPKGKALRANEKNKQRFDQERANLEARNLEQKSEATSVGDKVAGKSFISIRQAGDTGQLYGSVTSRDIADLITEGGVKLDRNQVLLNRPIKVLGVHEVLISLHPEVEVTVSVNVARSDEEAERQARGEDVTVEVEETADEGIPAAEEIFEETVLEQRELEATAEETSDVAEVAPEDASETDSDEPKNEDKV